MIDTFSANSLKILDKSLDEFIDKYIYHLNIYKKDKRALLGSQYHALLCQYIKGYDISKMKLELENVEIFDKFINTIKPDNFIKSEYPFLIKENLYSKPYFLTGRFDAIYQNKKEYIIYDWKTLNIPQNSENDLQTIIYLYAASKIFNTDLITMRYVAIEKGKHKDIKFTCKDTYKERIDKIVEKYYKTNNLIFN